MTETCSFCGNTTPDGENTRNQEIALQLGIVCDWLETQARKYCKCENNGDLCKFHSMLSDAKEAIKERTFSGKDFDPKALCKKGLYCGQLDGHSGDCDDIPF